MSQLFRGSLALLLVTGACASEVDLGGGGEETLGSAASALAQDNGTRLNGTRLNGTRLNGTRLNGTRLNGTRLNGTRLNGTRLNGSALGGFLTSGGSTSWVEGTAMVGAELVGLLDDGGEVPLRIDDARLSSEAGLSDVFYYTVSVRDVIDGTWQSICGLDADGEPVEAIAVAGRWDMSEGTATGGAHFADADQFTFGCADAAIGKCVEWGYKPWDEVERCDRHGECWTVPGADYHQTCTRLARADYCGDGTSSTSDGTLVNVYDDVGIEDRETEGKWEFEAEWDPAGAVCLPKKGPVRHNPRLSCAAALEDKDCGKPKNDWDAGTLIRTDLVKSKKK
jgi:uncharacterized protein YjbI with pentapeptide repeats